VPAAGRRERGERIRAMHDLHRALADVTRTGDEQLRGEAAQIVAEATSRLSRLLAADR
jgi:vacuolar-type H+-ATPase subunit H